MKIDIVLTACNLNDYYLNLYPYAFDVWKKIFNLDLYLILISDKIPDKLLKYEQYIILFDPIDDINSVYIAQIIRILYPCLFENKNVLITDVDIFPISKSYFIDSIQNISDEIFIAYTDRYINNKMIAICYNIANSNTWKKIMNINSKQDIIDFLKINYNKEYNGTKNCSGWYLDQELLYTYVMHYKEIEPDNVIIFSDKQIGYKRLDGKRASNYITVKNNLDNIKQYSDFHILRNYHKHMNLFKKIINNIIKED